MRRVAIFFLAVLMVCLPFLLRFSHDNHTVPGLESYYHLVAGTGVSFFSNARYVWEPYQFVSGLWSRLFGDVLFLPAFLCVLSFVILCFLLYKIVDDKSVQAWILLVFVLSPTFVSVGFLGGRAVLALLLILSGCLLLFYSRVASAACFVLAGLSGSLALAASIVFLLLMLVLFPALRKKCLLVIGLLVCIAVFLPKPPFINYAGFAGFFSDFGGMFGTSIFVFLLSIVGAVVLWSNKTRYYALFAILFSFFVACFFFAELIVYANVFACCLSGFALAWLSNRRWILSFLRNMSLLVLFCGLLFSSVSNVVALADSAPYDEFFSVLDVEGGTVLTHPDYGFWVQFSGHDVIADPYYRYLPDYQSRINNLDYVFGTNLLKDVKDVLKHYNVSYVLLTDEMSKGLVWSREGLGLAFLVNNAETFKSVNQTECLSLWKVK